jgi:amidohydrolase
MQLDPNPYFEKVRALRRDIHQHPELGFEVQRTAGVVARELKALGISVREGVGQTGVLGEIEVAPNAPWIALRADMDALPLQELNTHEFVSKTSGRAHMCGHDTHTAMLLGAAMLLSERRKDLKVNVRFVFQPNEENIPGGAPAMIQDGALQGVREIYGLHVWPDLPQGKIGICRGPAMAEPDTFEIDLIGRGGHAAVPHRAIDPIVASAQLVLALQTLVSRSLDPLESAVLSVTQVHAGTTHNVIPETARVSGTIRTFKPEVQKLLRARLEEVTRGVCAASSTRYELRYCEGYPVTLNHETQELQVLQAARAIVGQENAIYPATPVMGGEDFAYYSQKVPACFFFLGVRNEALGKTRMCHDPRFDIDEEVMKIGMRMHAEIALSAR